MSILSGVTTRDILAVLIVGAALIFNGVSLVTGRALDPTTVGLAGVVVGYYFRTPETAVAVDKASTEDLPEPFTGDKS